jgi:tetratricopeptide (TPR) repeat protein
MMGLLLLLALQDDRLANRCGSQIQWESKLEHALDAAQKQSRLVFWYVPVVDKSKMDKKAALDAYVRGALLTDPQIVELIDKNFVALAQIAKGERASKLGIVPLKFVEPGFVILNSQGELVHVFHGITTCSPEYFTYALHTILKKPVPAPKEDPLRLGRWDEARKLYESKDDPESRYKLGAVYYFLKQEDKAMQTWKALVASNPESPWAWRADMELSDDSPIRRAFLPMTALPSDACKALRASTDCPRDEKSIPKPAVEFLLLHQRSSGAWLDSRYDFGGNDSLPNVYVAITALCAAALFEWREVDPQRIDAALEKADAYLMEESNLNPKDTDEYIWAHLYRLLYFAKRKDKAKKMETIVASILKLQDRRGVWSHEYLNPFVTASVIHGLAVAKQAGVDIPAGPMEKAAKVLKTCRGDDGSFAYHYPPRDYFMEGSSGRVPTCELGMFLGGESTKERLAKSIDAFFQHQKRLLTVRKYDNHADEYHNGGFYFWYDLYGLSETILRLDRPSANLSRLKDLVVTLPEIDGSFIDSHELGKCYGTAMGLLTLKNCLK